MANPQLTKEQRLTLFAPLFTQVQTLLATLTNGDLRLMWALRRKLAKELIYLERSTPSARGKLKQHMWAKQNGICALCEKALAIKGSELDRSEAFHGYVESNVRLVHHDCHVNDQALKGFA